MNLGVGVAANPPASCSGRRTSAPPANPRDLEVVVGGIGRYAAKGNHNSKIDDERSDRRGTERSTRNGAIDEERSDRRGDGLADVFAGGGGSLGASRLESRASTIAGRGRRFAISHGSPRAASQTPSADVRSRGTVRPGTGSGASPARTAAAAR